MSSGSPDTAPSLQDFTNTFILSSRSNSEQVLFEVPRELGIDPSRQRRVHQKSRTGCENCRRRRVKCNEETPCAGCTQRGEDCSRLVRRNRIISCRSMPSKTILSSSGSTDVAVNLLHLKLFHHFQTHTCQTLLFAPDVWERVFQISFQFEFVMNAILCVAARHLAIQQPEDSTYTMAAGSHLCRSLSQFRHALSGNFTSTHVDVFIAMSILFQFEMWTSTDFFSPQENGELSFDPSRDRMFVFCSSLKEVFLKCLPLLADQESVIRPHIRYNPTSVLIGAAQLSDGMLAQYQDIFSYDRPLDLELLNVPVPYTRGGTDLGISNPLQDRIYKIQDVPDPIKDGYASAIARLCPILSCLPQAWSPESIGAKSSLLATLARYILSFPMMCYGPFASMVQQSDPHALLLLYHFYRAVRILLPPSQYWWAHKRATMSETALKEWLTTESAKQADA